MYFLFRWNALKIAVNKLSYRISRSRKLKKRVLKESSRSLSWSHTDLHLQLGRIIYINPFDIPYEAITRNGSGKELMGQQVSDNSYLVSIDKGEIKMERVASVKEQIQKKRIEKESGNIYKPYVCFEITNYCSIIINYHRCYPQLRYKT